MAKHFQHLPPKAGNSETERCNICKRIYMRDSSPDSPQVKYNGPKPFSATVAIVAPHNLQVPPLEFNKYSPL
jgi:hypothetical protein